MPAGCRHGTGRETEVQEAERFTDRLASCRRQEGIEDKTTGRGISLGRIKESNPSAFEARDELGFCRFGADDRADRDLRKFYLLFGG